MRGILMLAAVAATGLVLCGAAHAKENSFGSSGKSKLGDSSKDSPAQPSAQKQQAQPKTAAQYETEAVNLERFAKKDEAALVRKCADAAKKLEDLKKSSATPEDIAKAQEELKQAIAARGTFQPKSSSPAASAGGNSFGGKKGGL
jgi:hypothetical protein